MSATVRARLGAVLPMLLAALLVASSFTIAPPADAANRAQKIRQAVKIVANQTGDPYQYGAAGPNRFDCSGLIYYSYRKAGLTNIPRTSSQQANFTRRVAKKNMRRGDLMFFHDGGGVYHVGVFSHWRNGKRVMIHAPYGNKRVHRTTPWTGRWFAGTMR